MLESEGFRKGAERLPIACHPSREIAALLRVALPQACGCAGLHLLSFGVCAADLFLSAISVIAWHPSLFECSPAIIAASECLNMIPHLAEAVKSQSIGWRSAIRRRLCGDLNCCSMEVTDDQRCRLLVGAETLRVDAVAVHAGTGEMVR